MALGIDVPLRQFLHQRALKANNGIDPHEPINYRRQLVERWADVIAPAWSNRQPASLEVVIPRLEVSPSIAATG